MLAPPVRVLGGAAALPLAARRCEIGFAAKVAKYVLLLRLSRGSTPTTAAVSCRIATIF